MIRNLTLSLCAFFMILTAGRAQDIHFTLYDMVPVVFNPAESGGFNGTFRLSGIYRDQWLSVTGVPGEFKTPAFTADLPVIKGFRDNDWVGVGLVFYSDNSGSLKLKNQAFKISGAYHLALDKKGNNVLSFGYQTGSVSRKIDVTSFGDPFDPNNNNPTVLEPDPDLAGQAELKSSFTEHVGGLGFRSRMKSGDVFKLGVSVGHLGKTDISLGSDAPQDTTDPNPINPGRFELPVRIQGNASYRTLLTDRVAIVPSAFVQFQGKDHEILGQAVLEYLFNPERDVILKGGLGYRVGDAMQVLLGARIREVTVMASYDINVSRLTPASGTVGGFELSASIIGIIYKKPDPDPVLFCPRF